MIRSRRQYEALPASSKRAYDGAREVVAYARERDVSIARSIRELRARGIASSRESVRRYFGDAIERRGNRYVATEADRSFRAMVATTTQGPRQIALAGSRKASVLASHSSAVGHFLRTGDDKRLRAWEKRHADTVFRGLDGSRYRLETDLDAIEEREARGEISTEDIYAEL